MGLASDLGLDGWREAGAQAAQQVLSLGDESGAGLQVVTLRLQPLLGGRWLLLGAGPGVGLAALEEAGEYKQGKGAISTSAEALGRTRGAGERGGSGIVMESVRAMVNEAMCLALFGMEGGDGGGWLSLVQKGADE